MKWVKHMTDSRRDPKMLAVKRKFGIAGIGMYWVTVEAIAEQFTSKNGVASLSLDLASWREITGISPQMMRKWSNFGDEMGLFSASFSEKTLTISMEKINDIKDNHSRNLQATCKSTRARAVEAEAEEENKDIKSATPSEDSLNQELGGDGSPIVFKIPLADGTHANLTERKVQEWEGNFKFIDVRGKIASWVAWFEHGEGKHKRFNQKGWFFGFVGMLSKASGKAKAEMAKRDPNFDPNDPDGSKAAAVRRKETNALIAKMKAGTSFQGEA